MVENPQDHEQAKTQMASTSDGHRDKQKLLGNNDLLLVQILYKYNEYTIYISQPP